MIMRRWRQGAFTLVTSEHVLQEVERTLRKPYFEKILSPNQAATVLETIRAYGEIASLTVAVTGIATHPEDDLVLATVASGRANVLVTGDHKLQAVQRFEDAVIVTPTEFVALLDQIEA